ERLRKRLRIAAHNALRSRSCAVGRDCASQPVVSVKRTTILLGWASEQRGLFSDFDRLLGGLTWREADWIASFRPSHDQSASRCPVGTLTPQRAYLALLFVSAGIAPGLSQQ